MSIHKEAIKVTYWSLVGNIVIAIGKWLVGYFGHSFALIADAIESTSDIFATFLVVLGIRYSNKPADHDHPYGHGRAEPLTTFIVVVFLLASAGVIAYHAVQNILTPHQLPEPYTLWVLGGIIVIKEILYRRIHHKGQQAGSTALKAEAWHHRSDAITSLAGFIGISTALLLGKGYEAADDWAALLASGVIVYNAYLIFKPALSELMDEHLYDGLIEKIREVSKEVPGITHTEKCLIRKMGLTYYVDLHISVNPNITVREGHDIAHILKDLLLEKIPELADVLIHVEPDDL